MDLKEEFRSLNKNWTPSMCLGTSWVTGDLLPLTPPILVDCQYKYLRIGFVVFCLIYPVSWPWNYILNQDIVELIPLALPMGWVGSAAISNVPLVTSEVRKRNKCMEQIWGDKQSIQPIFCQSGVIDCTKGPNALCRPVSYEFDIPLTKEAESLSPPLYLWSAI